VSKVEDCRSVSSGLRWVGLVDMRCQLTFLDTVLLGVIGSGNALNALIEVVLVGGTSLGFLALCIPVLALFK
jgi:hypothetical protein